MNVKIALIGPLNEELDSVTLTDLYDETDLEISAAVMRLARRTRWAVGDTMTIMMEDL